MNYRREAQQGILDDQQFQGTSIEALIAGTIVFGILTALFGGDFGLVNWKVALLALWIIIPALLAMGTLAGQHFLLSVWLLLAVWLGACLALLVLYPLNPPLYLLALPVFFAGLFLSFRVSILTWLLEGALSFFWLREFHPLSLAGDWQVFMVSSAGMLLLLWMAIRNYHEMLQWSWENYRQGQEELGQAREQRGQLNQAVRDLAEANTQMMRLNQLLNAARYQAEGAERAKAEFVANVSHELRTPLNMILGYCELIMDFPAVYGARLPARLMADIAAIQRNSQHLTSLISDVLNISQFEAQRMVLRKEWVALQDVVHEAVVAVQPLIESRSLYLHIELPEDLPALYCDQTRIRQVLLNLVSNAARITEAGGITIHVAHNENEVRVTISDTGPGIALEDIPKLFQPFRQLDGSLKRKHGGSGLGLNISRSFVELHGGKIGVDSQVGVGSNFWFTLPLRSRIDPGVGFERWLNVEYDQRIHPTYANAQPILPRVVILEPGGFLYDQAARTLENVELERAETPEEALEILNKVPCQVAIVRGDGEVQTRDWAARVSASRFLTPVASCCLPKDSSEQELNVARYLVKPVDHRQLFETIAALEKPVRSILLVDDDSETLQLFTRILSTSPQKYRVLQSSTGEEALKLLRSRQVDLVILDLHMPGMDGFAFLEEKNRKAEWAGIPVVILSAEDPAGHPTAVPGLTITRFNGLSIPQVFEYALRLSEPAAQRDAPGAP